MATTIDVKMLCLGVLTFGDRTGYEIKKYFEEAFSYFFVAGYGSIYPALGELTGAGLVSCRAVAQARRPDKKVYSITEAGTLALGETLIAIPPRHKVRSEFYVLLYFAHLLPPARLAAVLDERAAEIEATLAHIDSYQASNETSAGIDLVAGLGRATLKAQRDYLRRHRAPFLESAGAADTADLARSSGED